MNLEHAATALLALAAATTASAIPLTGSGSNLPIASPTAPAAQGRTAVLGGGGWTGSWTAPAAAPWVGSFSVSGPIPSGTGPVGFSRYDFTSLPLGHLSSGTYFRFGDVDGGSSTSENFTLLAFDTSGNLITTPWLEEPVATTGIGTSGGVIIPTDTPGWSWNAGTGEYFIDGAGVTSSGNPTISNWLESNTNIAFLEVTRGSAFANFSLAAPIIPAPGSAALFGLAGLAAARRRR